MLDSLEQALTVIDERAEYRTTIHSDQGWHYQHNKWVKTLKQNKIFQSMSRKATCADNAVIENFYVLRRRISLLEPVDVLITHVPPIELISHRYFGSTDCFLNKLPTSTAKLYIFGHCHEQNIYEQNGATYCINALGYPWEGLDVKIQSIHY